MRQIFFIILISLLSKRVYGVEDRQIQAIVQKCVDDVHKYKSPNGSMFYDDFYKNFDAYYNQNTRKVESNAKNAGDQKALFIFDKCMALEGLPLKN